MLKDKNVNLRHRHSCHLCKLLTTVNGKGISSKELYIVKPKATCHTIRQASINACASVQYPI